METHSCKYCRVLVLKTELRDCYGPASNSRVSSQSLSIDYILQAERAKCPLFLLLLRGLAESGLALELYEHIDFSYMPEWNLSYLFDDGHVLLYLSYYDRSPRDRELFTIIPSKNVRVFDNDDNIFNTAPINPDPSTPETYALVKSWIDECVNEHSTGRHWMNETLFRPTRLLQIHMAAGEYHVNIVTNENQGPVHYVALSYRWGSDQPHKMTRAKFHETGGKVIFDSLPKTIQDAVKVTKRLGYEYLWVDSLCIMQDDDTDKAQEIAKMTLIYSYAIVTIAAAVPTCSSQGFLRERQTSVPIIDGITVIDDRGQSHEVSIIRADGSDPDMLPLSDRGWTLQETLLSARVLEYRPFQLRFTCRCLNTQSSKPRVDGWTLSLPGSMLPHNPYFDTQDPNFGSEWRGIVEDYTQRELSIPEDRILAVSGIATQYQRNAKLSSPQPTHIDLINDYVAGHWYRLLPYDLLWTLKVPLPERPKTYLGPSWSWVSVNSAVTFEHALSYNDVGGFRAEDTVPTFPYIFNKSWLFNTLGFYEKTASEPPKPRWDVCDVHVDLVDRNAPYGAVREAILTLRALTKSSPISFFSLPFDRPSGTSFIINPRTFPVAIPDAYTIRFLPDAREFEDRTQDQARKDPLTLVLLGWKFEIGGYFLHGLVLQPLQYTKNKTVRRFRRCGVFRLMREHYFDQNTMGWESHWSDQMPFFKSFKENIIEIE